MKGRRRWLLPLAGLAALAALSVPFLFWYQTWFGRPLSDAEMARDLRLDARPRDTQHALSLLAAAMARGDDGARRWYPRILALSRHPEPVIRAMAAWVMGQDNQAVLFHEALLGELQDPAEVVRRNAALALVRFGDASGRKELLRILEVETDEQQTGEALRGLSVAGRPEDLAAIDAFRRKAGAGSAALREQASLTEQAIRSRQSAAR